MFQSKKILLLAVLFSLISISCFSKQNPLKLGFKPSNLVGAWRCANEGFTDDRFTISSDGKISLTFGGSSGETVNGLVIQNWEDNKNKRVSEYSLNLQLTNGAFTFKFKSAIKCDVTHSEQSEAKRFNKIYFTNYKDDTNSLNKY